MKCLNCNQDNLESSNYCRKCGFFLKKDQNNYLKEDINKNSNNKFKDFLVMFDNPIIYISVFIISIIGIVLSYNVIIPSYFFNIFIIIAIVSIIIGRKICPYNKFISFVYFLLIRIFIFLVRGIINCIIGIFKFLFTGK